MASCRFHESRAFFFVSQADEIDQAGYCVLLKLTSSSLDLQIKFDSIANSRSI